MIACHTLCERWRVLGTGYITGISGINVGARSLPLECRCCFLTVAAGPPCLSGLVSVWPSSCGPRVCILGWGAGSAFGLAG